MTHPSQVPNEDVPNLHVPNSVPILYRFERGTRHLISTRLQSAAGGSHARWLLSPENHASIRTAINPGGLLTRAVLDSWDVSKSGRLTVAAIEEGINAMLSDEVERPPSCAVIAVAKKIVRELPKGGDVTVAELERRAAAEVKDITGATVQQNANDLLYNNEVGDFYVSQM